MSMVESVNSEILKMTHYLSALTVASTPHTGFTPMIKCEQYELRNAQNVTDVLYVEEVLLLLCEILTLIFRKFLKQDKLHCNQMRRSPSTGRTTAED